MINSARFFFPPSTVKFKKEFRNVFSCRKQQNSQFYNESTWFNNSRAPRHHISSANYNHSVTRMLRTQEVTYPAFRDMKDLRVMDEDNAINGDSV